MLGIRHPFTRALYERDADGNVVVTELPDRGGRTGVFTRHGRWLPAADVGRQPLDRVDAGVGRTDPPATGQ